MTHARLLRLSLATCCVATMSRMNDTQHPMLTSLARVCRQRRRLLEHTQVDVAQRAGVSRTVIVEFEAARSWPRRACACSPPRMARAGAWCAICTTARSSGWSTRS